VLCACSDFMDNIQLLETVTDGGIFTTEDEYKVICAVSNSALSMTLSDPEAQL